MARDLPSIIRVYTPTKMRGVEFLETDKPAQYEGPILGEPIFKKVNFGQITLEQMHFFSVAEHIRGQERLVSRTIFGRDSIWDSASEYKGDCIKMIVRAISRSEDGRGLYVPYSIVLEARDFESFAGAVELGLPLPIL